mmetsp:Transcript_67695/g.180991  ORF Transcript_67695/g.180991 Transcript_67695/m.180991 type:complete len:234 (+) Transcript_67695:642-1343(+)
MSAASRSSSTTLPASSAPPPSPSLSSNPSSFSASCHARMHPLQTRPRPPGAKSKPSLWLHVAMASFHVRGSSSAAGGPGALRTRMGSALAPAGRRNQHTTCTAFHYRPGNANSAHTHQLFHAHAGLLSIQARTPLLRRPVLHMSILPPLHSRNTHPTSAAACARQERRTRLPLPSCGTQSPKTRPRPGPEPTHRRLGARPHSGTRGLPRLHSASGRGPAGPAPAGTHGDTDRG